MPHPLRTDGSNAFARHSMAVRVPAIIDDTVALNPDYPAPVRDAFLRLRDEVAGDAPLRLFAAPAPDHDLWLRRFAPHAGDTWLGAEWFFSEMLVYRLMMEAGRYWTTLRDPFAPVKREERASPALWTVLEAALETSGSREERLAAYLTLTLWGNRIDLSLKQTAALGTRAHDDHLLTDDIPRAVDQLLDGAPGDVHVIMDNAGTEEALDLCLTDFLLSAGFARSVTLHVKMMPVLVSDVIVADVHTMLGALAARGGEAAALAARLHAHLDAGRLAVVPDFFWNTDGRLRELPARLQEPMRRARLVLGKGDVNYRRATNDALWPAGTTLAEAVRGFPAPLLLLRTLKSDTLVGLDASLHTRMDREGEANWRTSGTYGVAQFAACTA